MVVGAVNFGLAEDLCGGEEVRSSKSEEEMGAGVGAEEVAVVVIVVVVAVGMAITNSLIFLTLMASSFAK